MGFGNLCERFVNGAESGWLRFWYCMLIRIINKLLLSRMKYENLCSQIVSVANCLDDWDIRQLFILLLFICSGEKKACKYLDKKIQFFLEIFIYDISI